ncbi:trypsin-like peptidase domain-containing protein [Roseateles sp. NT4]|uniref:trypsin-like peptidase domain-containing protein n=1 Tax=Roseateles sp. NT4 TaxID=3453715 RepID=UPI003EEDA9E1
MKVSARLLLAGSVSLCGLPVLAQTDELRQAQEAFTKRNYADSLKLAEPLAAQGDNGARVLVARMKLGGLGTIKDEVAAAALLKAAAEADHAPAQVLYAAQVYQGNGVKKDQAAAMAWYRKAAELGDADGQVAYGGCLLSGLCGLPKDEAQGLPWVRKAAEQGNPNGQTRLGDVYTRGEGVEKDPIAAVDWYRKAAHQLYPRGERQLGIAYANGQGVAVDPEEALKWLQAAAYQRDSLAQEWVGSFFERGRAVVPDPVKALTWYLVASSRDSRDSLKTAIERVRGKLSATQQAEAQTKASQWPVVAEQIRALLAVAPAGTVKPESATPGAVAVTAVAPSRSSGTGFVVGTQSTFVVTNHHVIANCKSLRILPQDLPATVKVKDAKNDLAALEVPGLGLTPLKLRSGRGVRPGDDLIVLGFPLSGLLASGPGVSTGTLTNLGGINNDTSRYQISAPVQPGNSGGPVLDLHGQVIGVVVAQINAVGVSQATGSIPQNINFAVSNNTLTGFLDASGLDYGSSQLQADAKAKRMSAADVAQQAKRSTVKVECRPD